MAVDLRETLFARFKSEDVFGAASCELFTDKLLVVAPPDKLLIAVPSTFFETAAPDN